MKVWLVTLKLSRTILSVLSYEVSICLMMSARSLSFSSLHSFFSTAAPLPRWRCFLSKLKRENIRQTRTDHIYINHALVGNRPFQNFSVTRVVGLNGFQALLNHFVIYLCLREKTNQKTHTCRKWPAKVLLWTFQAFGIAFSLNEVFMGDVLQYVPLRLASHGLCLTQDR